MDVLSQPAAQRCEVTLCDLPRQIAQIPLRGVPELAGDHVAEAVGREVPEGAARPVHVLEHAVGVIGDLDPKVVLVARIPGLGQIGQRQALLEDLQLELEPDQDVEVVGHLVGFDPDQRALDLVCGPLEAGGVDSIEGVGETLAQKG